MEPTDVHPRDKTAHPPYAPSPKRTRGRNSFEHLEERLHALRDALRAAKQGDFSVRLPTDGAADGVMGEVARLQRSSRRTMRWCTNSGAWSGA
jgi:hypothetical protein